MALLQALGRLALHARPIACAELPSHAAACCLSIQQQLLPGTQPFLAPSAWTDHQHTQVAWLRDTIKNQGKQKSKKTAAPAPPSPQSSPQGPGQQAESPAGANTTTPKASTPAQSQPVLPHGPSILQVSVPSSQLSADHIGNYYQLQPDLLPEAFPDLHQTFYAQRGPGERPRSGGCLGLQREMAVVAAGAGGAQRSVSLMHREVCESLWDALAGSGAAGRRVLLRGPTGSGKSCAVAALVERARASGWLALYVPSATALVKGGLFEPCREVEDGSAEQESGSQTQQWDTPISAQHMLLGLQKAHGPVLSRMPVRLAATRQLLSREDARAAPAGATEGSTQDGDRAVGTPAQAAAAQADGQQRGSQKGATAAQPPESKAFNLGQLVTHGLAADDAHTPVDSVLALLQELVAASAAGAVKVLFAVDDYNALYGETGYGVYDREQEAEGAPGPVRIPLRVEQLRLANALRLLEQPAARLAGVQVVAATSHSVGVSRHTRIPSLPSPRTDEVFVPRFSQVEVAHALHHYWESGVASRPPTKTGVTRLLLLTNGNAAELRELAITSALYQTKGELKRTWALA